MLKSSETLHLEGESHNMSNYNEQAENKTMTLTDNQSTAVQLTFSTTTPTNPEAVVKDNTYNGDMDQTSLETLHLSPTVPLEEALHILTNYKNFSDIHADHALIEDTSPAVSTILATSTNICNTVIEKNATNDKCPNSLDTISSTQIFSFEDISYSLSNFQDLGESETTIENPSKVAPSIFNATPMSQKIFFKDIVQNNNSIFDKNSLEDVPYTESMLSKGKVTNDLRISPDFEANEEYRTSILIERESKGILLKTGSKIRKDILEDLILKQQYCQTKSTFKLCETHLSLDREYRQNVTLAIELLSNSTAAALEHNLNTANAKELSYFMQLTSDWFDLFNSKHCNFERIFQQPYKGSSEQNRKLNEICDYFKGIRWIGKKNIQEFQKALILSCNSLQELYQHMQSQYKVAYILTDKLNTSALENLFLEIRTENIDENPSPLEFLNRLRLTILGKMSESNFNSANFVYNENENYVVNTVLKAADIQTFLDENFVIHEESVADKIKPMPSNKIKLTYDIIEQDGLRYLTKWIVQKFKNKLPELETYTDENIVQGDGHYYNKGGPIHKFTKSIKILEWRFKKLNRNSFAVKKRIVKKLYRKMKNKIDLPEEIIKTFIKQRIFIRMKKLNTKIYDKNENLENQIKFSQKNEQYILDISALIPDRENCDL